MESFNDFWDVLSNKSTKIEKELNQFLSNARLQAQVNDFISEIQPGSSLSDEVIRFLRYSLNDHPYPSFNFINILKDDAPSEKVFDEMEYYTATSAIENVSESKEFDKVYCILANLSLIPELYERLCVQVLPVINQENVCEIAVVYSLLSRNDDLLDRFLEHQLKLKLCNNPKKYMFNHLALNNQNVLYEFMALIDHHSYQHHDHELSQYARAIKLIDVFNNQAAEDIDMKILLKCIEPLLHEIDDPKKNKLLKLYLLEIRREQLLMKFLQNNSSVKFVNVFHFSRQRKILYEILDNVSISYKMYERLKPIVIAQHNLLSQMLEEYNPFQIMPKNDELEFISIILCTKIQLDLMLLDESQEDYLQVLDKNITQMKEISKNIKEMNKQLRFCEILFATLFIRFEDFIENPLPNQLFCCYQNTIVESSNFEQKYPTKKTTISNRQLIGNEFMACESLIRAILNFLKMYLVRIKRSHAYIEETETNVHRHTKILEHVNDALYRLSIITKCISQFIGGSFRMHTIHLDSLLKPHQLIDEHELSTDEEEKGYKYHASRRRLKKLRKSKISIDSERTSYSTTNGSENVLLDMKCSYSSERGRPRKMLNKMLSSPDTLATLCASRGDMIELKNVIKKYNYLLNSPADHYVRYMEKFEEQKLVISNALNKKNMDFENKYENEFEASKIVTFSSVTPIIQRQEELDILEKHKPAYNFLRQYEIDGMKMVSLLDLTISLPCSFSQNQFIYTHVSRNFDRLQNMSRNELRSHGYVPYCYNLIEYLESYKHVYSNKEITIQEFLTNEFYPLNEKDMTNRVAKIELFLKLNKLNSFASVETLEDKCYQVSEIFKFDVGYFQRLISYLNTAKKLLDFHSNEFDFSPDSLLMLNLDTIIGEIVNIEKVPPTEIEELVVHLGKNLAHVLMNYNLCPIITQTSMTDLEEHALLEYLDSCLKTEVCDLAKYDLNESCLKMESSYLLPFIERSNLMTAKLIREIHGISTDKDSNLNINIIRNLSILPQIQILSKLFNSNSIMTVLNYDNIDLRLLHKYLISTTNFKEGVHSIESIKEIQYKRHQIYFEKIKDIFLARLIDASDDEDDYWYLCKIVNFNLKSEYVNKHLHKIKDNVLAKRLLKDLLSESYDKCLRPSYIAQIKEWIIEVEIYEQIALVLGDVNWLEVRQKSMHETHVMFHEILDSINELYNVLPKWIELHPLNKINDSILIKNIKRSFKMYILKNNNDRITKVLFHAIDSMKTEIIMELYEVLLMEVNTLKTLKYVVDYLQRTSKKKERYQKYQISIKIFECLNEVELQNLWSLKAFPLLILEQFLMNTRFEILAKILSTIKPLLHEKNCKLCHDNYESDSSSGSMSITNLTQLVDISNSGSSDYIMINYDSNHIDEYITVDCVNVMLRLYASKALDIRISERYSAASYSILSRASTESSRSPNMHQMPKEAPPKESWVIDEDAGICMSCNKAIFTLLTRRHHCRRCGRVVCHICSTKRVKIPELYGDVLVRACNNCFYQMEIEKEIKQTCSPNDYCIDNQWQLTGSEKHDNVVREEFSYEYAPNVNLCLSICDLYLSDHECAQFLLHQASKLETLFRPVEPGHANPEMDYELVGKMIHCLALAAKVRGASDECNEIIAHSDIMQALVENKCESLMPMEPINLQSIRKLRDTLIRAEQWQLALEISTKYHFPTVGVMASWGIICLKAGCFMTAREKFAHCFKHVDVGSNHQRSIFSVILSDEFITVRQLEEWEQIKRPAQSPGLLNEILNILENSYHQSSFRSAVNNESTLKETLDCNEHAYNFTSRLKNLKNITQNIYDDIVAERKMFRETRALPKDAKGFIYKNQIIRCKYFEESTFYLNAYGTHVDIIEYLIKHHQIVSALRYILIQKIKPDTFVHRIYYPCLRQNNVDIIFDYMMDLDETLILWKNYILHLCRHLEKRSSWKELYDIQVLIKDPIRASMTCIKFYTMNCNSYRDLMNNRQHLIKAQRHLEAEFELASHWENIKTCKDEKTNSLIMKRDMKTLGCLLKLISMQLDTAAFLAQCELDGYDVCENISKICADAKSNLPTLFDSSREKLILAVLIIILGKTIDTGFTLSSRIIVEFNLDATQVYGISAKYLATNDRIKDISSLICCIHSKAILQSSITALSDEILCLAVKTGFHHYGNNKKNELVALISDVKEVGTKIMCYIYTNQLKSAYLLAVKNDRINDIKKILRKAELIDQKQVKKLCEKKLLLSKTDSMNV